MRHQHCNGLTWRTNASQVSHRPNLHSIIRAEDALRPLNVIASGAKQSISPRKERMDCFVASLLAMTLLHMRPQSRGAMRPSWCRKSFGPRTEGAGKAGCRCT
jgi:hypothetical protein